ncbi:LytTR family transcriptional regulator [Massilia sp. Root351]|jgi:two-component system LytT family response regulator|uniref:LytR/AlgR family response regulator transcription factor n=1 Tax=Massilia sp. Root351 TaxID=1736522 RepID=UPI00070DF839|nr:LytTR family DNA-binding domain-containing protein [Massilia sp. Root351]KQV90020.1 LytTR family transcriptional regulator [Massilia sp. Root351]
MIGGHGQSRDQIRALIVDDEEPGRVNLRYALAEHPHWLVAGECSNAAAARAALEGNGIDVLFLDVQMPNESGLVLARELAQRQEPPLIVFVTAYNSYAVEAFDVHALDYLLKPFDDQRFAQAVERAQAMLAQRQRANYGAALRVYAQDSVQDSPQDSPQYWRQLSVRSVGRIEFVQLEDVLWMEAAGNYVELHMAGRRVLHRVTLGRLEQHLDPARYARVHRSAIVPVAQIARLESNGDGICQAVLRCGDTVPVSERHLASVKARLGA